MARGDADDEDTQLVSLTAVQIAYEMSNKPETRAGTGEVLYRSFAIDASAISSNGDRQVQVAWASEEPIQREFGLEILRCTADACALERLNNRAALLYEHDPEKQIGVVVPGTARFDSDRKGRCLVKFSKSVLGQEQYQDVIDGVRANLSVGYSVEKYEVRGDDTYIATRWQPVEVSLVSIPADISVGVGRSTNFMKEEKSSNGGADSGADDHRAIARERARIFELQKVGRKFKDFCSESDINRAIESGTSVKDFQVAVIDRFDPEPIRPFMLGDNPLENSGSHGSFGQQVIESRSYRSLEGRGLSTPGAKLIVELPNATYSTFSSAATNTRTTVTGLPNTAVQIVPGVPKDMAA